VLGGAPALTAPTDRRRLQQLQRQRLLPSAKRQRQQAAAAAGSFEFNFYSDGGGAMVSLLLCCGLVWPAVNTPQGSHTSSLCRTAVLPVLYYVLMQGGEEIGLDGDGNAGLRWEGQGTSEF
jgi:hypothetical protein